MKRALLLSAALIFMPATLAAQTRDGRHDFDWEHGDWTVRISRLTNALSADADVWAEYEGTSTLRPFWDGQGNFGELNVAGPAGTIRGLSLRTYDPQTGQWRIHWSNAADGVVGPPMVGGFENGVGRFYNQETYRGRAIFVRFIMDEITPTSWKLEQAFSDDGGTTWETNWIARFQRVR
jgi:hypothetical protein